MFQFIIFAALFAVAAASSYKAAEYEAPKDEAPKYEEEVTYVNLILKRKSKSYTNLTGNFHHLKIGSPAVQLRIRRSR